MVHLVFQLHVAASDHDGIVDVSPHLDRTDYQIAEEKQRGPGEGRNGEIDPDTALDDQDQQYRHPRRSKGEQQHHQEDGHHADHRVVRGKRGLKISLCGGVSSQVNTLSWVIFLGSFLDRIQKGVGLLSPLRQGQIDQHPVIFASLELQLGMFNLLPRLVQIVGLLLV